MNKKINLITGIFLLTLIIIVNEWTIAATFCIDGHVKYFMCEFNSGWLEPNGSSCEELLEIVKDMGFVVHEEIPKVTRVGHGRQVYSYQDILFKHRGVHHINKP